MSSPFGEILWRPRPERIESALVTAFRREANRRFGLDLQDHDQLHAWSVADRESFWRLVWDFCGVVGDGPGQTVLDDPGPMPGARWFPSARLNYAENLLQGPDERPALIFRNEAGERREWSFGRLRAEVAALASAMAADGIGPGDRVAGLLPNLPETVAAMLATASLGAVWTSCSPDFGARGILDRFGQIEPVLLFAGDGYRHGGRVFDGRETVRQLAASLPTLKRIVMVPVLGRDPAGDGLVTRWDDYRRADAGPRPSCRRLPFDHPLFIMYSSGTTGLPKCMVHSAGGTLLQHRKEHALHCDLGPDDRIFYFTTCGWMMWNWLVGGLAAGAVVVLYDGSPLQPRPVLWDLAGKEGITIFGTSARWLAASEKFGLMPGATHDLSALRAILSTGAPLAPESFDYVYREVKADLQLSSISGGTDIISCFALGSPVLPVRRGELQCRGLGMAVAVFDEKGEAVAGEKGELVCTSAFPSMPVGFWNDPRGDRYRNAYFRKYPGIWCHGDFAELRPGGGMVIHGRSDTVLNPGGVRIGTAEIYRVVESFPQVAESVVVGLPREGDVRVMLFLVLAAGESLTPGLVEDIKNRIRTEASSRHVPASFEQAPEIPRTLSGKKVELAVLRALQGQDADNAEALANPASLDWFRRRGQDLKG